MQKINATIFKCDGTKENIHLYRKKSNLDKLQKIVDGYIQIIEINENDLVLNEEGILLGLPPNPWSIELTKNTLWKGQIFFGDIILVDGRLD